MKVLFDTLGAPAESGGMRLHATELIRAWLERYPGDQLVILGAAWVKDEFSDLPNVRAVVWNNDRFALRAMGQIVVAAALYYWFRPAYLVSLSPIASPLVPGRRAVCFQHDWRHKKNREEFPWTQRFYRNLWVVSAKKSRFNACISEKAQTETIEYAPGARTALVPNGGDHARRWPLRSAPVVDRQVVTFGHHNNKRPELVLRALAEDALHARPVRLVVLGAKGSYCDELNELLMELGDRVTSEVVFPGFVSEAEYQAIVQESAVVVMASSDEGFGLPMAEADYLRKASVLTSDSGVQDLFPEAIVAEPTPTSLAAAIDSACSWEPTSPRPSVDSWYGTASALRRALGH